MSGEDPCRSYRVTIGYDGWLHSIFLSLEASKDESDDGSDSADDAEDDDDGSPSEDEMST